MQKVKTFAFGMPVLFSALVITVAVLLTEIPLEPLLTRWMNAQHASYLTGITEQFLTGLLALALIAGLGLLPRAGFRAPQRWSELWLAWPLAALTAINALDLWTGALVIDGAQPLRIGLFVLLMLSVGFFEEVLCRGLMLVVMVQKWGHTRSGLYAAVLVSSLLFGAAHVVNIFQNRITLLAGLVQIGYGFFFGVIFAALFLRLRSIWPVILLHAAFDFAGGLREISVGGGLATAPHSLTPEEALVNLLITLPLLLVGLWILRKVPPTDPSAQPQLAHAAL